MDIEWCERFHLENISDLDNRILNNDDYNQLWVVRCNKSYNLLSQTTESFGMFFLKKSSSNVDEAQLIAYNINEPITRMTLMIILHGY